VSAQLSILPAVAVEVIGLEAVPNPVSPGQTLTIIVTIAAAAPEATAVVLATNQQPFGTIPIEAGAVTGQVQLEIPPDTASGTIVLTATSGGTQAETTVQIVP
jgi:hypothetical protein